jgi:GTPase SAR1 family protein
MYVRIYIYYLYKWLTHLQIAVVGDQGAGKSTVLEKLAGK